MMIAPPYFISNKNWYEYILELPEGCKTLDEAFKMYPGTSIVNFQVLKLTEKGKSIPEVVKSYEEWQNREVNDYEVSGKLY